MKNWIGFRPVIVPLADTARRAAEVFGEEIALKTGIALETSPIYLPGRSNVVLCDRASFDALGIGCGLPQPTAEGFTLLLRDEGGLYRTVFLIGADARGIFFGMGKLLRLLYLSPGNMLMDGAQESFTSSPKYPLRGQQLAYRDKQNTCPCWTQKDFDRYIRDLALFGNNAIEILPPRTDDNLFSRVFHEDPFRMMLDLSRIIHSYGLDVWLWYPNMGQDYTDPALRAAELKEREEVFSKIPYLDAVLIPAGDPGELLPDMLFPVCEESARVLHKYHPEATVWLAPQAQLPIPDWYEEFYARVDEEPDWLYGLCFAPWEQHSIQEMHARVPEKYKSRIRHYPDITHNIRSQFALTRWDRAFAIIEGRECNNTRPKAMKRLHNHHAPYTIGSLTYSEGIHDDVNKFVWSQQDWDDSQPAVRTVREYVRYFIDPAREDAITRGLMLLEDAWDYCGPVAENAIVDENYALWSSLYADAPEHVRGNYRFLLGWMRALSDYYIKHKQIYDDAIEAEANAALQRAAELGADCAMRDAAAIYQRGVDIPWNDDLRDRILRLSDTLFALCGIKLTTHHHNGQYWRRGAYIDLIDFPLNDMQYNLLQYKRIRALPDEAAKLAAIERDILRRKDPGEGGLYCDVGSYESLAHIEIAHSEDEDPGMLHTAYIAAGTRAVDDAHMRTGTHLEYPIAREWLTHAMTYYDTPLTLHFDGLSDTARYRLRIVYIEPGRANNIRLTTGKGQVIHESLEPRTQPFDPIYEFPLPEGAISGGRLTLTWQAHEQLGGVAVNELMLIRAE